MPLASEALLRYPLAFLTGHLPVAIQCGGTRDAEGDNCDRGGLLFVDDHNHDVDGVFHKTCTEELTAVMGPLVKIPNTHSAVPQLLSFRGWPAHERRTN